MLTVFFDCRGVVHYEFLPAGQKVNRYYYLMILLLWREAIRRKRPEMWRKHSWVLYCGNALFHSAIIIREFLTKYSANTAPQAS